MKINQFFYDKKISLGANDQRPRTLRRLWRTSPLLLAACYLLLAGLAGWFAWAATQTWDFNTASQYTLSDASSLQVTGGTLRLKARKPSHLHDSKAEFDAGTYSDTEFQTGDIGSTQSAVNTSDSGLVSYWKMNEGSSTAVGDSKGSNSGTLNLGTGGNTVAANAWVNGVFGKALDFDGTDDYVSLTDFADPSNFTISGWIEPDIVTGTQIVFEKLEASGDGFALLLNGANLRALANAGTATGATTLSANVRYHAAATYDGSSLKVYVNGVSDGSADAASLTFATGTAIANIGRQGYSPTGTYFDGTIDDLTYYNRALSASEIQALYAAGAAVHMKASASLTPHAPKLSSKMPALFAYWTFDVSSGTAAADMIGSAKGALTNMETPTDWVTGVSGKALDFDGIDEYVSVPNPSAFNQLDIHDTDGKTIAGWFNRDTFTTDDTVLARRNGIAATDTGYIVYIDDATDKLYFEVSDGVDEYQLASTSTFTSSGWNHFAIVWDPASAANTKLYINGSDDNATATGTIGNIGSAAAALVTAIGAESDAGNPFDGRLDEIAVFGRRLSTSEAAYLAGKKGETATYTSPAFDGEIAAATWDKISFELPKVTAPMQFNLTDIGTSFTATRAVAAGDMDGDGDMDLVAGNVNAANLIKWYKNDGNGSLTQTQISTTVGAMSVAIGDLTRDKANEFVVADNQNGGIKWFKNDGLASPAFAVQTTVASDASPTSVAVGDINNDGYLDIVAGFSGATDKIVWYLSDGAATPAFTAQTAVVTSFDCQHLLAKDINNDGYLDIVAASNAGNTLAWYKGDGGTGWTATTISSTFTGAQYAGAADMDADGDLDLTAAGNGNSTISWFANDGSATPLFSTQNNLSTTYTSAAVALPLDFDADGDMDVLTSGAGTLDDIDWWKNNGSQSFTKVSIDTNYGDPLSLAAADLTGDGQTDIAVVSNTGNKVSVFLNRPWIETWVNSTSAGELMAVADFNGDGDLDVANQFQASGGGLSCWDNDGSQNFTSTAAGDTTIRTLALGDIDGDGDIDTATGNGTSNVVAWWENASVCNPVSWTKRAIATEAAYPVVSKVVDINGDGRQDVLFYVSSTFHWKENNGGTPPTWTDRSVGVGFPYDAADLDGDGDMDTLGKNTGQQLVWWENTGGAPPAFTQRVIANFDSAFDASAADMDNDGDLDVLAAARTTDVKFSWFENTGGAPPAWTEHVLVSSFNNPLNIKAGDLEGDGDMDVYAAVDGTNAGVYIFENLGSQNFIRRKLSSLAPTGLDIADLDRDGDLDPIIIDSNTGYLLWYDQQSQSKVQFQVRTGTASPPSAASFVGPDNTAYTYFAAGSGIPSVLEGNNRYGQYQVKFYRSDSTLDPMIKNVKIEYTALPYSTLNPYGDNTSAPAFTYLTSFTATTSITGGVGALKYQLSPNSGTTWKYYNAGWQNWDGNTSTAYASQASDAGTINTNIATFDDSLSANGTLKWRAFLNSDGNALTQLDNLDIGIETASITLTSPVGGEKWKVGTVHPVTWGSTGLVPADLVLEYDSAGSSSVYGSPGNITTALGNHHNEEKMSGAVSVWQFDGATSGAIADTSTAGLQDSVGISEGTATGAGLSWAAGKLGGAVNFPGTGPRITVPSTNYGTTHSVCLWVNLDVNATQYLLDNGVSSLYITGVNVVYTATNSAIVAHGGLNTGTWYHLCVTRSGTSVNVYKNGAQVGTTQTLGSNNNFTVAALGATSTGLSSLDGSMDAIAVFNRVLTASEISFLSSGDSGYLWTIPVLNEPDVRVRLRSPSVPSMKSNSTDFTVADIAMSVPNTAVTWKAGKNHTVTWTADTNAPTDLVLEYSIDGPHSVWTGVSPALTGTDITNKSYTWNTPSGAISSTVQFRIRSTGSSDFVDTSNVDFTVADINITAPNGSATQAFNYSAAAPQTNITWTPSGSVPSDLVVEYSSDAPHSTWTAVSPAPTAGQISAGSYPWTLPNAISSTVQVRVRSSALATDLNDTSNANFRIYDLTVTAPAALVKWPAQGSKNVTWTQNGLEGSTVKLEFWDNGVFQSTFATGISKTALSQAWNPIANVLTTTAKVRIVDETNTTIYADSAAFEISPSIISIIAPIAADVIPINTVKRVNWKIDGPIPTGAQLTLEYSKDGGAAVNITNNISPTRTETGGCDAQATGCYDWTVPPAAASNNVVLTVKDNPTWNTLTGTGAHNAIDGVSGSFRVTGSITVQRPNGGEKWATGFAHSIQYQIQGSINQIKIYYATNSPTFDNWTEIDSGTAKLVSTYPTGYSWTPPRAIANATIKIKVEQSDDSAVVDLSNNAFTLTGITVTAPDTASRLKAGDPFTITWTRGGVNNVKIEYSENGGAGWVATPLFSSFDTTSLTSVAWPSNLPLKTMTGLRVRITDADAVPAANGGLDSDLAVDSSDASSVLYGTITVTAPDGSEDWAGSSPHDITWTVLPAGVSVIPNVKIFYSTDNFATAPAEIDTGISKPSNNNPGNGTGKYSWTPTITATNIKLRVADANDPAVSTGSVGTTPAGQDFDDSNNFFQVSGISIASPTGSPSWTVGSTGVIQFGFTGSLANVRLRYAADGATFSTLSAGSLETSTNGSTWTAYAQNGSAIPVGSNPFYVRWTVPDNISTNTKIDITQANADGSIPASPKQSTSGAFTITGALSFTTPSTLVVGNTTTSISWTKTGTITSQSVQYSTNDFGAEDTSDGDGVSGCTVANGHGICDIATGVSGASQAWNPVPNIIGNSMKVRVVDTTSRANGSPSISSTSSAFSIKTGFAVTAPISTDDWAANRGYTVTGTYTGTVNNINIDAIEVGPNTVTSIASGLAASGGTFSRSWTIPANILGVAKNVASDPKKTYLIRVTDATAGRTGNSVGTNDSQNFEIVYYKITWAVRDSVSFALLSGLSVSETDSVPATIWTGSSLDASANLFRYYAYDTYTSTFSKTSYSTAAATAWVADSDKTVTVYLESDVEKQVPYEVKAESNYDDTNDRLFVKTYLVRTGSMLRDETLYGTATVEIFNGTTKMSTLTKTGAQIDLDTTQAVNARANGYSFTYGPPTNFVIGNIYFLRVSIVYNSKTYSSGANVSSQITLAGKIQNINALLGTTSDAAGANSLFGKISSSTTAANSASTAAATASTAATAAQTAAQAAQTAAQNTQTALGTTSDTASTNSVFGKAVSILDEVKTTLPSKIDSIKPLNRGRILDDGDNRIPLGGKTVIRFQDKVGASPVLNIYSPSNTAVISSKSMTASTSNAGVYIYEFNVLSSYKTGNYLVTVTESSSGTLDSKVINVVSSSATTENIASSASTAASFSQNAAAEAKKAFEEMTELKTSLGGAEGGGLGAQLATMVDTLTKVKKSMYLLTGGAEAGEGGKTTTIGEVHTAVLDVMGEIRSVASKQGVNLDAVYQGVASQQETAKEIQNAVAATQAAVVSTQEIVAKASSKPILTTWFEAKV